MDMWVPPQPRMDTVIRIYPAQDYHRRLYPSQRPRGCRFERGAWLRVSDVLARQLEDGMRIPLLLAANMTYPKRQRYRDRIAGVREICGEKSSNIGYEVMGINPHVHTG